MGAEEEGRERGWSERKKRREMAGRAFDITDFHFTIFCTKLPATVSSRGAP